ncbi:MAG: redoxin domain-containing protein [Rhodospirillaceae bacterium]|nr:redoxin domain-containing protein [Rhodospirillaceae bacterium]
MAIVFAEERLKTAETMMSRRRRGDRTGSAGGLWERQGLAGDVRSGRTLRAGDRAPRFRLVDEAQQPVTLTDELQHGPVVLSFLAGDGAAQAIGRLAQWAGRIAEAGGSLFAVLPDVPASAPDAPEMRVLHDAGSRVAGAYGLRPPETGGPANPPGHPEAGLPATFVIDRQAHIALSLTHASVTDEVVAETVLTAVAALGRCQTP